MGSSWGVVRGGRPAPSNSHIMAERHIAVISLAVMTSAALGYVAGRATSTDIGTRRLQQTTPTHAGSARQYRCMHGCMSLSAASNDCSDAASAEIEARVRSEFFLQLRAATSSIQALRRQIAWMRLRSFRVTGPLSLKRCLQPEMLELYGAQTKESFYAIIDGRTEVTLSQVPMTARRYMRYLDRSGNRTRVNMHGRWEAEWSAALVDTLVALAAKDEPRVAPDDYPLAALQYYRALARHSVTGREVLVAGSISPWLEAIAISRGAASVASVDYTPPRTASTRIRVLAMESLTEGDSDMRFDAIFSYSSVEHDGLGRYGDPINPFGDVAAMGEFALLLKPGGVLYLGLPVGRQGNAGTGMRCYDATRFTALTRGWELVETHSALPDCVCGARPHHFFKNGAPLCCRNISESLRLGTWNGSTFWEDGAEGVGRDSSLNQPLFVLRRTTRSLRAALEHVGNGTSAAVDRVADFVL